MEYYFLSKYRFTYIYIILPIIVCIVIYVVFAIYYKVEHKTTLYRAFCHTINQSKLMIVILTAIISLILIEGDLMLIAFNDNRWWFTENTRISKNIGDWGDFATCLAAFFALISILLAYKAFISQVNASKRTSFDATFTQIFAQHKALHDKVVRHDVIRKISIGSTDLFTICRMVFERVYIDDNNNGISIGDFYDRFNSCISPYIDLHTNIEERDSVSCIAVDFKNYFKYIYHEVNIVVSQSDDVLNDNAKEYYIQLIQAQMNYDELLCYFINQVEYLDHLSRDRSRNVRAYNNAIAYATNLRNYGFFRELCKSRSGHADLVRRILGTDRNGRINNNSFVEDSWFFHRMAGGEL